MMTCSTPHRRQIFSTAILTLIFCFVGCGENATESAVSATQSNKSVVSPDFNCSFTIPETWDVTYDIHGANIHATAPTPTGTGYTPNLRLVASHLADGADLQSYWAENRDELLSTIPQCKIVDEESVTLANGLESRRAVFTYENFDSTPLAMYVCIFTHAGRGYSLVGLVPAEQADAYEPTFTAAFDSINFN